MKTKRLSIAIMCALCATIIALAQLSDGFSHTLIETGSFAKTVATQQSNLSKATAIKTLPVTDNKAVQRKADEVESVEIYGYVENNFTVESNKGLIKFNSSTPAQVTRMKLLDTWATAGAYARENYYVMAYDNAFNPTLYTVDLETGEITLLTVCSLEGDYALQAFEMSYDVIGRQMYMLATSPYDPEMYNSALLTVDLTTGEQTYVNRNMGRHIYAMAINAQGEMYGVDGYGMLCKINLTTGETTDVAKTTLTPFYRQSMDFDRETGIAYWAYSDTKRKGVLYTLDVTTGTVEMLGAIGGREEQQVVGLHVPYSLYTPLAPSFVTGLNMTPHAAGELSVELSWTCPTTRIDGTELSTIDAVEISRNGVLVATLTGATPGATMTWSDTVDEAGIYTYMVQLVNEAGVGELRTVSAYVGRDLPAAVSRLHLERTTPNSITLSWEAVTRGVNGGYVDTASMRYKVTRISDNKILAEDLAETTIVDNSIVELGTYRYAIESYNADGVGGVTTSGYIVNGPARSMPIYSNFDVNDPTEADLWSVGDANGDGISFFWNYDDNYRFGAYYYQTFTMQQANDWLISPPVNFEGNTPYKVVVEAAPANATQPEQFSIYLIQDYNLSTAIKVGETFDVSQYDMYRVDIDSVPAGVYSVCVRCTSNGVTSNYLAIYSIEMAINGDGNIRGDVWDDSSRPVADVYVSLDGTEYGAYTDARGFFEIPNVPSGNYTLNSIKMGYKSISQVVTVEALKDVNVELDVIKRKAYTVSGKVCNEYGEPLANALVRIEGYNNYSTYTAADGSYSIANVYEAESAYSLIISKDFYVAVNKEIRSIESNLEIDATLQDAILQPVVAYAGYNEVDYKMHVEWSRTGVDEAVAAYSDQISYTFGAADGTFGTLIGVVCHKPIILQSINWFLLSSDETINVVVLALDENGNVTGEELYVDADAPNVQFNPTDYTFNYEVYAPHGCFIGLSADEGFLDIVTAVNTPEKPFVPHFNAFIEDYLVEAKMEYVEVLGDEYCENFFLGYQGIALAGDEAPVVTYNVYRENESAMSEVVLNNVPSQLCTDDAWLTLPEGDYTYAVTAVYANNKESARTYTSAVTLDKTAVEGITAEAFAVALSADGNQLQFNTEVDEAMLYTADGVLVAQLAHARAISVANQPAGMYMVRARVGAVSYVEKVIIK
ncbi:MAG: carboxypeptidase regulatory-like domain-containing protein [Bacteroidaceae bacterium]|nr:carboxypeptidase regulatory-like domain-containing protein [Bacteroidaceae bacterium]